MENSTIQAINKHAEADFPKEACGLVVIARGRERYVPCKNVAKTPSEHFVIDARDYASAEDVGEVVAVVHSHPNVTAQPSEADRVSCEASELPWHIVPVSIPDDAATPAAGEIVTITPSGYRAPLVGRTFAHGVLDCWALCRDWFLWERGIELPSPRRADNWWNDGESDLYSREVFEEGGFVTIPAEDRQLQVGDVITMQIRSKNMVANHAGIYVGDGKILHHLYGRLSSRDVYGGYWAETTRNVFRYKDLGNV